MYAFDFKYEDTNRLLVQSTHRGTEFCLAAKVMMMTHLETTTKSLR